MGHKSPGIYGFQAEVNHKNILFLTYLPWIMWKENKFSETKTQSSASFLVASACKTCELHIAN